MVHARLSPSSSSRWLSCTASVEASENYKNSTNSAAEWGTNVHFMGEQLLKGKKLILWQTLKEGDRPRFTIDEEMLECAEDYAEYCRSLMTVDSILIVEEQYDLSCISEGQFGTSDCTILNDKHLHIVDLKTGFGIVYAEKNTQLMLYAIGAVEELEAVGHEIETITLHISQKRANHTDEWTLSYDELMEFKSYAKAQADKILSGKTEFNPNEKACQWCPHQVNCEALANHVFNTVKGGFDDLDDISGKADLIDNSHIKSILDNVDLIQNFIKAVQEVALEKLNSGEEIEGYKLVESRSNRKWSDEELVEAYLKERNDGIDYYQPSKLKPMTQILKILKDDEKLQKFIVKPDGKPVVAPIGDKRKAIKSIADSFDEC